VKNFGYYTESLFVRELDLEDMKIMMKEDILLLEKAMNMLCKNKVY